MKPKSKKKKKRPQEPQSNKTAPAHAAPTPAAASSSKHPAPPQESIEAIIAMGFTHEQAVEALAQTSDVNSAIDLILKSVADQEASKGLGVSGQEAEKKEVPKKPKAKKPKDPTPPTEPTKGKDMGNEADTGGCWVNNLPDGTSEADVRERVPRFPYKKNRFYCHFFCFSLTLDNCDVFIVWAHCEDTHVASHAPRNCKLCTKRRRS